MLEAISNMWHRYFILAMKKVDFNVTYFLGDGMFAPLLAEGDRPRCQLMICGSAGLISLIATKRINTSPDCAKLGR